MEPFSAVIAGASEVAPHVYDVATRAVQYESYGDLVLGVFLLAFGLIFLRFAVRMWNTCEVEGSFWYNFNKANGDDSTTFCFVMLSSLGGVLSICSLKTLLSVWTYAGLFDPDARMLREIVRMLLK